MKALFIVLFTLASFACLAFPADSLKKRKHFAIEGDVSLAHAKINPIRNVSDNAVMATLKAPVFSCYNLAVVYNWRGFTRDGDDPVHEFSMAAGASIMKINVEETMRSFRHQGYNYHSDVSFGTEKINFSYTPTELCFVFRYTYSTKKYFVSLNAGVSSLILNDTKSTTIPERSDYTYYQNNTTETVYSTYAAGHYLVPNGSVNNLLGLRFGLNGKRFNPYLTLQRHGANTYSFVKIGAGMIVLL